MKPCLLIVILALLFLISCGGLVPEPVTTETPTPSIKETPTVPVTKAPIVTATETPHPDKTAVSSFFDDMKGYNDTLWHMADGWTNGDPFWVGWRADHIRFLDGSLVLRLDDQPCASDNAQCSGRPYASGEYRTNAFYHYGRVDGRLKAAEGEGIVTSLFIYTGPTDRNPHDEIDIEILGKDTTRMQINYYTNGVGGHETLVSLGFDAAQDFHTYSFEWLPDVINWYVDGVLVHTKTKTDGPLPTTPGRIMMNLWSGIGVDSWLGSFSYLGSPIDAYYDWIKFAPSRTVLP